MQTLILTKAILRAIYLNHAQPMVQDLAADLTKEGAFDQLRNFIQDMEYNLDTPQDLCDFIVENELHIYGYYAGRRFVLPDIIMAETESVDGQHATYIKVFDALNAKDLASWHAWHGAESEVTNDKP